jgi:hypothetical protein
VVSPEKDSGERPAHSKGAAHREPRKEFGVNLALPTVRLCKVGWYVLWESGRIARVKIGVRGLEGTKDPAWSAVQGVFGVQ